jgi:protein-L-isoaspartate(D-aspartate) O-methyltransferase
VTASEDASAVEARGALVLLLRQAGVRDVDVLRAIETVPREIFVPYRLRDLAARNCALPIACGQTMAAPRDLAAMLEALQLHPAHRVMEVGAGSGYATTVIARIAREVVSFERFHSLALEARTRLDQLGVINAAVLCADGFAEPERHGRFDRIIVHACLKESPTRLLGALAPDGRLVCALDDGGGGGQEIAVLSAGGDMRRIGPIRLGIALGGPARAL